MTTRRTVWNLRYAVDACLRGCAFLQVRRGGRWNRIAIWKADMLVRSGLARWLN